MSKQGTIELVYERTAHRLLQVPRVLQRDELWSYEVVSHDQLEGVKVLMDKDARSIGIPLANLSQEVRHHLALNAVKSEFCVFIFR